jgi:hypothetical protein
MTAAIQGMPFGEMLYRVQKALHINQKELAGMLQCSERTVSRYYDRGGELSPAGYATLATACHPHDRDLAVHVAQRGGHTLESLGLEHPPVPPAPAPALQPAASPAHLADSIVCAAAEALDASPRTIRPAVRAALERMVALGMTASAVLEAMAPRPAPEVRSGAKE